MKTASLYGIGPYGKAHSRFAMDGSLVVTQAPNTLAASGKADGTAHQASRSDADRHGENTRNQHQAADQTVATARYGFSGWTEASCFPLTVDAGRPLSALHMDADGSCRRNLDRDGAVRMSNGVVTPFGSPTTNFGWTKPTVGGDPDVWGGYINANLDGIDTVLFSMLPKAGGVMTGALTPS